jgi:PAS domain S-box-containing protein
VATPMVDRDARAEQFLGTVLDCVAQPVWVVDEAGAICFANPAAVAALGYADRSELYGRPSHETIHHHRPDGTAYPSAECPMLLPRTTGETVRSELDWFFRLDGSMFPVSYVSVPIDLPGGRGAVVAFEDIEARRRDDELLQERDAILATVTQPVWVIGHDGLIRYANRAALEVLGYDDLSELLGRPGHATVHYKHPDGSPYPVEECPITNARLAGEPIHASQDHWIRKDGSFVLLEYSAAPIATQEGLGAVVAFTDVEARARAEQAVRERDIARARAAELAAARRRIIEASDAARRRVTRDLHDGAQQRFVSAIMDLQLAQQRWDGGPGVARDHVDRALEQAREGVAELRELAAGIHPAILAHRGLQAAVEALADRFPLPLDLRINVPGHLPGSFEASAYFFVSEALTNVVKHAGASRAAVHLEGRPGRLTIEVSDDGAGGVSLDAAAGTGLRGLADRVAALDGVLTISSPPGAGTVLRAELPLQTSEHTSASVPSAGPAVRRMREAAGMSAGELAERSGLPEQALCGIERGDAPPSLRDLYAVADALGRPMGDLLAPPVGEAVGVVRAGEGPRVVGDAVGAHLLGRFDEHGFTGELYALHIRGGSRQVSDPHPPGVREMLLVQNGRLRAGPLSGPVELGPGDFAEYAASEPHAYEAVGVAVEAVLLVLTHRRGT